jgi:hypothetical protein
MDSNRSYNSSTKLLVNPNLNQAAYIYMHVLASRPKMQRFGPFISCRKKSLLGCLSYCKVWGRLVHTHAKLSLGWVVLH